MLFLKCCPKPVLLDQLVGCGTYNWKVSGSIPIGVVLVSSSVCSAQSVLLTHPPPSSGRNHISCGNHGSETRVSYLHRGNPRRFSLNIPNKTVGLKLKKDQP